MLAEVVRQDSTSLDWWSDKTETCTMSNLTSSRLGLGSFLETSQIVSSQTDPIPADMKLALEFNVPENMSSAYFLLCNVSGETLPLGQMPYNSKLWLNGGAISLDAPFVDVGYGCSGGNGFVSLGNYICYRG